MLAPNYAYAHYRKGSAHYNLNQYDQAIDDFNAALAQGFDKPLEIYKVRWQLFYQKKDYDAALSDLREAIKLDPSNVFYNRSLGDIYLGKEQWSDALTAYKTAAQANRRTLTFIILWVCRTTIWAKLRRRKLRLSKPSKEIRNTRANLIF